MLPSAKVRPKRAGTGESCGAGVTWPSRSGERWLKRVCIGEIMLHQDNSSQCTLKTTLDSFQVFYRTKVSIMM
jgi:hypothetical protein